MTPAEKLDLARQIQERDCDVAYRYLSETTDSGNTMVNLLRVMINPYKLRRTFYSRNTANAHTMETELEKEAVACMIRTLKYSNPIAGERTLAVFSLIAAAYMEGNRFFLIQQVYEHFKEAIGTECGRTELAVAVRDNGVICQTLFPN